MSEENKPTVEIKSDQAAQSIGKKAYLLQDGHSKGWRESVTIAIALTALIFVILYITAKKDEGPTGKAVPTPTVSRDDPQINPKLLTERDLVNVLQRSKVTSSALGRIKVVNLRSSAEIPIGSDVMAVLESGATDGIVKAKLQVPLLVDGEPVLPEQTVVFGKGKSSEERLFVQFNKAILPTGESYPIRAQAFDFSDRILGLKGAIVGAKTKKMMMAMGFGFLGGMANGLQQDTSGSLFYQPRKPSVSDAALAGASKAALDQSQAYIDEMKQSPNIIQVKVRTQFILIFDDAHPQKEEGIYEPK